MEAAEEVDAASTAAAAVLAATRERRQRQHLAVKTIDDHPSVT